MLGSSRACVLLGLFLLFTVHQSQQCSRRRTVNHGTVTTRPPKPPNRSPRFHYWCSHNIPVSPEKGKTGRVVTWPRSKTTASDPEHDYVYVTPVTSKASGSYFTEGKTSVTYKAYDGNGGSDYCNFQVEVTVTYCPEIPHLRYGYLKCSGEKRNVYGSVCTSECYSGYQLEGAKSVGCLSSGTWNASFPTCQRISCGNPTGVENGIVRCPFGHRYPAMCVIQCGRGYRSDAFFISCWKNGSWEHIKSCLDVAAPTFPDGCPDDLTLNPAPLASGVAVNWSDPQVSDNSGQVAEVTSSIARGSVLAPGSHPVTLTAADAAGNKHSCRFTVHVKVLTCPALEIPFGSVSCSSRFMVGSQCSVTCNKGYRVRGNATVLTCESTDQGRAWSPANTACEEVKCPEPKLQQGSFVCPKGHGYSQICVPVCAPGFQHQGLGYIQCTLNGSWTALGHCRDIAPPTFPNGCPDNINSVAAPLGEATNVTWEIPDATDNAGPVQLSSDHQPGSDFPSDVTIVKYTATDESGNKQQCSFTVTVTTLVCDKPDFEQGNAQKWMTYACPGGYVYGAACSLNCTYSFPLLGSGHITCNKSELSYPPTAYWGWPGSSDVQPKCLENRCPKLDAPENGALACQLGNFGWDCLMMCQDPYDVPGSVGDGHFYCTNSNGYWTPKQVPDCSVRRNPREAAVKGDLYYYANSCNVSLEELKASFISRMKSLPHLKDVCVGVATCTVKNVQVHCGPTRGKRSAASPGDRTDKAGHHAVFRRQSEQSPFYVLITFEMPISVNQSDSLSAEEVFEKCDEVRQSIHSVLVLEVQKGTFDEEGLHLDPQVAVGTPALQAVCPSGTVARALSSQFSCVGCSAGHFLPEGTDQCQECPVGSYSDIDNATECAPCPEGHSTLSTASTNSTQCLVQCPVAHLSPSGFVPCQPCPAGQYQAGVGATRCDRCPVNTWTLNAGSSSLEDCADANIVLNSQGLTSMVNRGDRSRVTVILRIGFPHKHSNVTVSFRASNSHLDMTFSALDRVDEVKESKQRLFHWFGFSWARKPTPQLPDDLVLTFRSEQRRVILSSLGVFGGNLTMRELASLEKNCRVNTSRNLLTWSPDPSAILMPSQCDAVDECSPSPCGDHGVCLNLLGGYECRCLEKWSGARCQTPPDPCSQHQCQNAATCLAEGWQNYTCTCPPGFLGQFCELEKVDGGWTEWQAWSQCSCGGQQQRQRRCSNPAPQNQGRPCPGDHSQLQNCSECFVDDTGVWSNWTEWSACSVTCGGGQRSRNRTCERLLGTGQPICEGSGQETVACGTDLCPVHGGWSQWSAWSQCSVTCANGTHSRERSCDTPVPAYGGNACNGTDTESETCAAPPCPECDILPRAARSMWRCAVVSESPYLKECNFTCLGPYVIVNPSGPYTCGHETAFLWNHQRKINGTIESSSPTCSRARPLSNPTYNLKLDINTDCDPAKTAQVLSGIEDNLHANISCLQQGLCKTNVTTVCKFSRKRSTPSLQIVLNASLDVNITDSDMEGNASAWDAYQDAMRVADDSLPDNDTLQNVFTVSLPGGETVTPDLSSVDSELDISCQPGTVLDDMACADCPVGSMEENGSCELCPREFYQDQPASTSCKPCPPGFSWDLPGAPSIHHCTFAVGGPSTLPPDTTASLPEERGADSAMPIGVGVGVTVVVVLILATVLFLCYKRKNRRKQKKNRRGSQDST